MDKIEIEININEKIHVEVKIGDVIDGINKLSMKTRWNYIARILNETITEIGDLEEYQLVILQIYLRQKLDLLLEN